MMRRGTRAVPEAAGIQRHAGVGVAACAASVLVHILLALLVPEFSLWVPKVLPRRPAERLQRFKVEDVNKHPPQARSEAVQGAPGAGGQTGLDPARSVNELQKPPDPVLIEPRAAQDYRPVGDRDPLARVATPAPPTEWQPRQEILAIERKLVPDEIAALPRLPVPRIERILMASDIVPAVDASVMLDALSRPSAGSGPGVPGSGGSGPGGFAMGPSPVREPDVVIREPKAESGRDALVERRSDITPFEPIEQLLVAEVRTFTSPLDRKYAYARIDIRRAGPEVTPVMPKDIVLVQDCSASMTEQKLHFCREGLSRCLAAVGNEDRFNVIGFRDRSDTCFPGWVTNSTETLNRASQFISEMRAEGNTDIFASIRDILTLPRAPGRPLIALLVTDGRPTVGVTGSSDIIAEFSRLNDGRVSVFTVGTVQTANSYLLDILSYCNRGDAAIVTRGRWDIPGTLQSRMVEISRPVLADVNFLFASNSGCEFFPVQTSNLFLDRPLVLFGRYPRTATDLVFQAVGTGRRARCDMVFNVSLRTGARPGDESIRDNWAKQKVYHLMGQYARHSSEDLIREMEDTARRYDVRIPYKNRM